MREFFKKDIGIILILLLISLFGVILFWDKMGDITVDLGRELLIPEQMLDGLVLYKDIFNIYGPVSYQINALLYLIFDIHLKVLYISGIFTAFLIIIATYLVSREVLDKKISTLIAIIAIFLGIFNIRIWNYILPYTFAMTYALAIFSFALLFFVKYWKTNNPKFAILSSLFIGFCTVCKYDFWLASLFLLLVIIYKLCSNKDFKTFSLSIISFCAIPFISLGALFIQGLRFHDIFSTLQIIKSVAQTKAITHFYMKNGFYYSNQAFYKIIIYIIILAIIFCIIFYFLKNISKLSNLRMRISLILLNFVFFAFVGNYIFLENINSAIPLLNIFLILFRHKFLLKNPLKLFLITAIALSSLKIFFATTCLYYQIFLIPLNLISFFILLEEYYSKDKLKTQTLIFLFLGLVIVLPINQIQLKILLQNKIKTERGSIPVVPANGPSKLVVDYIIKKTPKDAKIVILPEGQMINFLTQRKTDAFYSYLLPLYTEAIGDDKLIEHFKDNMPEYFIISTRDTDEYGKDKICEKYAIKLCSWIYTNYDIYAIVDGKPQYFILKKKEK